MKKKRPYVLKRRAERLEETRRRIAEATAALHAELGPAATTISAIAERAGVERYTVYRHFPDEGSLLRACQHVFRTQHPYPDIRSWSAESDAEDRLRRALRELYAWYRDTEATTANIRRDAPTIPALAEIIQDVPAYFAEAVRVLAGGFALPAQSARVLRAAIGHAVDFDTWRSLVRRQGLTDSEAVEVMVLVCRELAGRPPHHGGGR